MNELQKIGSIHYQLDCLEKNFKQMKNSKQVNQEIENKVNLVMTKLRKELEEVKNAVKEFNPVTLEEVSKSRNIYNPTITLNRQLPFKTLLNLVKNKVLNSEFLQKYRNMGNITLRDICIEEVMQDFIEFSKQKNSKNSKVSPSQFCEIFCQLMGDDFFKIFEKMHLFSHGVDLKILLSQKDLLNIPFNQIDQIEVEDDLIFHKSTDVDPMQNLLRFLHVCQISMKNDFKAIKTTSERFKQKMDSYKEIIIGDTKNKQKNLNQIKVSGEEIYIEFYMHERNFNTRYSQFKTLKKEIEGLIKNFAELSLEQQCVIIDQINFKTQHCLEGIKEAYNLIYADTDEFFNEMGVYLHENEIYDGSSISQHAVDQCGRELCDLREKIIIGRTILPKLCSSLKTYLRNQEVLILGCESSQAELDQTALWMSSVNAIVTYIEDVESVNSLPIARTKQRSNRKKKRREKKIPKRKSTVSSIDKKATNANFIMSGSENVKNSSQSNSSLLQPQFFASNSTVLFKLLPEALNIFLPNHFHEIQKEYQQELENNLDNVEKKLINGKKKPQVCRAINNACSEVKNHSIYAFKGFEKLIQALESQNFMLLGVIVPTLIMDLFIQQEQILRLAYIHNSGAVNFGHNLSTCAGRIGLYGKLPEKLKKTIDQMHLATYWVRYPNNSFRYYKTRKIDIAEGLKLVEYSQQIGRGESKSPAKIKKYILSILKIYRRNFELLSELQKKIVPTLVNDGVKSITALMKNFEKNIENDYVISKNQKIYQSQETVAIPINQLKALIEKLKQLESNFSSVQQSPVSFYFQEAQTHIHRLIQNIHIYEANSDVDQAWIFRNLLNMQLIFESLYAIRCYYKTGEVNIGHNLSNFHDLLQDPPDLNANAFCFNKSYQYSTALCHNKDALAYVNFYHELERNKIDSNLFDQQLHEFLQKGISLLDKHINACEEIDQQMHVTIPN